MWSIRHELGSFDGSWHLWPVVLPAPTTADDSINVRRAALWTATEREKVEEEGLKVKGVFQLKGGIHKYIEEVSIFGGGRTFFVKGFFFI